MSTRTNNALQSQQVVTPSQSKPPQNITTTKDSVITKLASEKIRHHDDSAIKKRKVEEIHPTKENTGARDPMKTNDNKVLENTSNNRLALEPKQHSHHKVHQLPMKGTFYLDAIQSGRKKFEGRINGPACQRMRVDDRIEFLDRREGCGIVCRITSLEVFNTFKDMLLGKGILNLLPQLASEKDETTLLNRGIKIYQSFPGADRIQKYGCVAIGVEFIEKLKIRRS